MTQPSHSEPSESIKGRIIFTIIYLPSLHALAQGVFKYPAKDPITLFMFKSRHEELLLRRYQMVSVCVKKLFLTW